MFHSGGALDSHKTFLALPEQGIIIYGGKASMTKYDGGGHTITIDPSTVSQAPTYNVTFIAARKQEFSTVFHPILSYPLK